MKRAVGADEAARLRERDKHPAEEHETPVAREDAARLEVGRAAHPSALEPAKKTRAS